MECHQMKSVISLVDSLVRSTHVNRSRIRTKSPTDFSICSILGVESDVTQSSSSSGKYNVRNYDVICICSYSIRLFLHSLI